MFNEEAKKYPYWDEEHQCMINNRSDEATVNGWCQEINRYEILDYIKKHTKKKSLFKRIFSRGR